MKIKILYTIPNFDTAGSGKVVYDLAKNLDKNKFEVHIACTHNKGAFFKEVEQLGLPIHFIETTCKIRPYWSIFNRIKPFKNFIKQNNFHIVHSWHWSSDWTEVVASRLGGAKFIYTKKAMTWGNIHWKIRSYLADYIVTTNPEMSYFFPNKKNQSIIPFGVDVDYFKSTNLDKNLINNTLNIITVANLVPVKAIEDIIHAIKLVTNPEIRFLIIGDDQHEYATLLKELVKKLNLENQIQFLGKKIDVRTYHNQSHLYIISSKREGLPVALLEAMSMGLPVIGSDIPGIRYVLNDFSELLFEQGNYNQLAEKIIHFCNLSAIEKEKIGQNMREHCVKHFSLQTFIKKHEELYLKIAKK